MSNGIDKPSSGKGQLEFEDRESGADEKKSGKSSGTSIFYLFLEALVVVPVIIVLIGAYSVPTILHALPDSQMSPPGMPMPGMANSSMNSSDPMMMMMPPFSLDNGTRECSDGFYLDDGVNRTNLCRPECGTFLGRSVARQVFEIGSVCLSLIASVLVFILAATVQRKTLLVFPTVIFVYSCAGALLASGTFFIGILDSDTLYCDGQSDYFFVLAEGNETPFTSFNGMVFLYVAIQRDLLVAFLAIFLFWGTAFPFSYRQLKVTGRIRYAHYIILALSIILPIPGPLVHLFDQGYQVSDNPNLLATPRNSDLNYFILTLPACFLLCVVSVLLALMFWIIFKEFVIKKVLSKRKLQVTRVGKAEIKIVIVITYFSVFSVVGIGALAYVGRNPAFRRSIGAYIFCEAGGSSSPVNCLDDVLQNRIRLILAGMLAIAFCSFAFWPVVVLIFVIDFKAIRKALPKLSRASTSSTNAANPSADRVPKTSVSSGPISKPSESSNLRPSVSSIGDE